MKILKDTINASYPDKIAIETDDGKYLLFDLYLMPNKIKEILIRKLKQKTKYNYSLNINKVNTKGIFKFIVRKREYRYMFTIHTVEEMVEELL